jgi:hypothetical protein
MRPLVSINVTLAEHVIQAEKDRVGSLSPTLIISCFHPGCKSRLVHLRLKWLQLHQQL